MDIGIIAARYAKALLNFATENHEEDLVYSEMQTLSDSFLKVERLQTALLNPLLTKESQEALLLAAAAMKGREGSRSLPRFVHLVVERRRSELMQFVAHSYVAAYRKKTGKVSGRLIVPAEVSDVLKDRLRQVIEQKNDSHLDFEVAVQPEILGGFILEYDTYRLDASVKTQLEQLQRELK